MSIFADAIQFASSFHCHQSDKQGEPYILHPLRVALAVRAAGHPETYQAVAILHDVIEDTQASWKLLANFGHIIVTSVASLTRRYEELPEVKLDKYGARMWGEPLETHAQYFERCVSNPIGRIVKYYDILDNMDPKRFTPDAPYGRYLKCLQWYKDQEALRTAKAEQEVSS